MWMKFHHQFIFFNSCLLKLVTSLFSIFVGTFEFFFLLELCSSIDTAVLELCVLSYSFDFFVIIMIIVIIIWESTAPGLFATENP